MTQDDERRLPASGKADEANGPNASERHGSWHPGEEDADAAVGGAALGAVVGEIAGGVVGGPAGAIAGGVAGAALGGAASGAEDRTHREDAHREDAGTRPSSPDES